MRFVNTIEEHRREHAKSLDSYLKERRLSLGQGIVDRHKVYLDTKYWLLLRNHQLGRSRDPEIAKLADLLIDGVTSAKLICPISADVFMEILKQTDTETLNCSIGLIDTLSEGVSVLSPEERGRMELLQFVLRHVAGEESCHGPKVFVWTKLAYVLGFTNPGDTPFSPEEELTIQKAFLDQMWDISLTDMVETMGIAAIREMPRMPDISSDLNAGKFANDDDAKSFQDVFLAEIAGILDTFIVEFREMFTYLYRKRTGGAPQNEELAVSDAPRQFANLIYHGFRLNRFSTEMPSLRIPATLHAAIRWERSRKYEANDMHDIGHASAALPYFDTFLTEHSLRHLLTRKDLGLDRLYDCMVVSDPRVATETIRGATSQPDAAQDGKSADAPSRL
jgi:hypothetical protein